mmetsp:Transcript_49591/g.116934  ORF Transcript_49591/g.116934 Transcript_49591/m.116934 type:complete len:482 (+) Transcript_49591:214-1659(+)
MPVLPEGLLVDDYYREAPTSPPPTIQDEISSEGLQDEVRSYQLPSGMKVIPNKKNSPSRPRSAQSIRTNPIGSPATLMNRQNSPFPVSGSPYYNLYKDGSHGNRPPSSQGTNKDYLRVEDEKMAEWRNVNGMWTKDNSAVREAAQNYWTAPGSSTEGRVLTESAQRNRFRETQARNEWRNKMVQETEKERRERTLEWTVGYTGHVPRLRETFAVRNKVASDSVCSSDMSSSRNPFQVIDERGGQRRLLSSPLTRPPGTGFVGTSYSAKTREQRGNQNVDIYQQGTRVHLKSYYDACEATNYRDILIKAGFAGKNKSSVHVGDSYFYSGKHMYETTQKEAFRDPKGNDDDEEEESEESIEKARTERMRQYTMARAVVGMDRINSLVKQLSQKVESKVSGGTGLRRRMFTMFDKNGTGEVDQSEFRGVCYDLGVKLTQTEAVALFGKCDVNGDGGMNFYEFLDAFVGTATGDSNAQRDEKYYD